MPTAVEVDDVDPSPSPLRSLTHPWGRPLHPLVATFAIGCWGASLAFDAVSHVSDTEFVYSRGAYLLTALGVAAALPASLLGLVDLLALERGSPPFRTGLRHLLAMDVALVLFTLSFLVRRTSDFAFHDATGTTAIALSLAGAVALAVGLWHAGALVHRFGVGRSAAPAETEAPT